MISRNINDDNTLAYLFNKMKSGASDGWQAAVAALQATIASIQTALNNKVSKSGDTMTGVLTMNGKSVINKNPNYSGGDTPSSNSNLHFIVQGKDGNNIAHMSGDVLTTGATRARLTATNGVYTNAIQLVQNADGTRSVAVTDSATWRTALGLGSIATVNSPVPIANGGTGATTAAKAKAALSLGNETHNLVFQGLTSTGQIAGFTFKSNGSGSSYNGNSFVLGIQDTGIFLWDSTDATTRWSLTNPLAINRGGTGQTAVSHVTSGVATAGSNITVQAQHFYQWGKLAQVSLQIKTSAAISADATIATIASGKRPACAIYAFDSYNGRIEFATDGKVITRHSLSNGATVYIYTVYMLP